MYFFIYTVKFNPKMLCYDLKDYFNYLIYVSPKKDLQKYKKKTSDGLLYFFRNVSSVNKTQLKIYFALSIILKGS